MVESQRKIAEDLLEILRTNTKLRKEIAFLLVSQALEDRSLRDKISDIVSRRIADEARRRR